MTQVTLGETARFVNGAAFKPEDWSSEGLPIIRIQNLTGTGELFNRTKRVVKPELIVEPGDLLVSWSATLDVYRWAGPRGLLNQHIFKVLPRSAVDPDYLYYALKSSLAELSAKTHGSTMKHVVRGDFESTRIRLPALAEQRRIADLLARAEGIVRLRREAQQKAAQLIPAIFIDMFGDPATNPNQWPVVPLGEVIKRGPSNGLYKHKSAYGAGTPILRIDGFYDGVITDLSQLKRVRLEDEDELRRFGLAEGDIVVNRVNSPEYLGKSAIVPRLAEPTVFESNMMRFGVAVSRALPEFVIALLQQPASRRHLLAKAKHAINQSSINQQDVKSLPVPLPPVALQQDFAQSIRSVTSIRGQQAEATSTARASFDALLSSAFRGA